jgi:hypothetical protein
MNLEDKSYEEIVKNIRLWLKEKTEWEDRYDKYSEAIRPNLDTIKQIKSSFHQWSQLFVYTNVTDAMGSMKFRLRYRGQKVADLFRRGSKIIISTKGYEKKNERDFKCDIKLNNNEWNSEPAICFRKHFSDNPDRTKNSSKGNEEHRIESLLLTEFETSKRIKNIQPVKIAGVARFQMPTPFSGSKIKAIKYSDEKGGGIDILCRIGKARGTQLCVFEVKDENKASEPPEAAIKQALVYGIFIIELLRSKSGAKWWEIFGFNGGLPKKINLTVACAMPYSENINSAVNGKKLIVGSDTIDLQSLFFVENNNKVVRFKTSIQCITRSKE